MSFRLKFKIIFSAALVLLFLIYAWSKIYKLHQIYFIAPRIEKLLLENTDALNELRKEILDKILRNDKSDLKNIQTKDSSSIKINKTKEEIEKKEKDILSHIIYDGVEKGNDVYSVLLLISSHTRHAWRRNIIRHSWGDSSSWTVDNWKIVFIVGYEEDKNLMNNLRLEATTNKDIVIENIRENFYDLAKKVIIGLTWAKYFMRFENILKGDDDTFMNIDNIIKFVKGNQISEGYFGQKMEKQPVERDGRYKVTKEEHEKDTYDPYCSGGGFILTNLSVYKILPNFDIEKTLRIDDAHIGEVAYKTGYITFRII